MPSSHPEFQSANSGVAARMLQWVSSPRRHSLANHCKERRSWPGSCRLLNAPNQAPVSGRWSFQVLIRICRSYQRPEASNSRIRKIPSCWARSISGRLLYHHPLPKPHKVQAKAFSTKAAEEENENVINTVQQEPFVTGRQRTDRDVSKIAPRCVQEAEEWTNSTILRSGSSTIAMLTPGRISRSGRTTVTPAASHASRISAILVAWIVR